MSKRSRENKDGDVDTKESQDPPQKKQRKGFSVGPANLPDGTYRRKTQKIKNDLISKAKVRKAYAKIKAQEEQEEVVEKQRQREHLSNHERTQHGGDGAAPDQDQDEATGPEIHPERQAMMLEPEAQEPEDQFVKSRRPRDRPARRSDKGKGDRRKPKPDRYKKEFAEAEERKARQEEKQKAIERRDHERRAMIKAKRPGKDGRQRLGRQGTVLLSRVQRLVGEGKL